MYRIFSISCLILLFSSSVLFAQKGLNSYKYVLVPNQYEFQKSKDQYQINSLTKFLFDKEGYTTLSTSEGYPVDLATNPCLALKAKVKNNSGLLKTKIVIELVDCYNSVVYTTEEGASKIKDYKKGYHDAIRKSFESMKIVAYEQEGLLKFNQDSLSKYSPKSLNKLYIAAVVSPETEKKVAKEVPVKVEEEKVVSASTDKVKSEKVVTEKAVEAAVVVPVLVKKEEIISNEKAMKSYSIEGEYFIDVWGECVISKKGDGYAVIGGDEDFEFATIFNTSKPTIFMIKKVGFKQTQLLELDENGNLKMDTKSGVKIYKRID